mgnify:CR=1 FL=1
MVENKSIQEQKEHFATAKSFNLPISYKQSYEIANYLRGRNLVKAKQLLQYVINKKIAVPYKRFNRDTGHKPGIAAGRYPEKASKAFLMILNSVEANAENNGLDPEKLFVTELRSTQGSHQLHGGRQIRRKMKRTHLYIKVQELEK